MDKTGKLILFGCIALLVGGFLFQSKQAPAPAPKPPSPRADANGTVVAGVDGNQSEVNPLPGANTVPVVPGTNRPPVVAPAPAVKTETNFLANAFVKYTFTSAGGGISRVDLIEKDEKKKYKYPKEIGDDSKGPMLMEWTRGRLPLMAMEPKTDKPVSDALNAPRPYYATPSSYQLTKEGDTVMTLTGQFGDWQVAKKFTLGEDYLMDVAVTVSNTSTNTVLPEVPFHLITGTAHEPAASSAMMGTGYGTMWHDGEEETSVGAGWFDNYRMGCACFGSVGERNNYRAGNGNIRWIGGYSRFFIQAVIPEKPAGSLNINRYRMANLSAEEAAELGVKVTNNQQAYETSLVVKVPALPAGAPPVTFKYTVYTGPREYDRLTKIGKDHGNNSFHRIMDFGGWFGWVAEGLLRIMKWFEPKLNFLSSLAISGYAMAIIAITIIIKLIFWPITARSTRAMKKMAAVNAKMMPEITKVREKYKGDYQQMNMKMMEIYKKYGVNPLSQMGGCLPLLIQIPIFFGFFTMLRSAVELRGSEFLWVADLSSPDTIASIFGFPINIMPLLMTGTMFLQMRLQPPSPTMDPTQQAIMKYMPLMFVFILYSASAGLCLYWTVNNVLSIVQTKMTKLDPLEENKVEVIPPNKQNKKRKR